MDEGVVCVQHLAPFYLCVVTPANLFTHLVMENPHTAPVTHPNRRETLPAGGLFFTAFQPIPLL